MNISIGDKTIKLENYYRIEIEYNKFYDCNILYIYKLNMYQEDLEKYVISGFKPRIPDGIEYTPIRTYINGVCTINCIKIKCKEKIIITY